MTPATVPVPPLNVPLLTSTAGVKFSEATAGAAPADVVAVLRTMVVPLRMLAIVAPEGMPRPVTSISTAKSAVVDRPVIVVLGNVTVFVPEDVAGAEIVIVVPSTIDATVAPPGIPVPLTGRPV